MTISTDLQAFARLDRALAATARQVTDKSVVSRSLALAARPMLDAARSAVPVGKQNRIGSGTRTGRGGKTRRDGTYDRGGATKRDLRIRTVPGIGGEVGRVLVGVSKKRGSVGWRTHFITRVNKRRRIANDFLARAERLAGGRFEALYVQSVQTIIDNTLRRL